MWKDRKQIFEVKKSLSLKGAVGYVLNVLPGLVKVHHSRRPQIGNGSPPSPSHGYECCVLALRRDQVPEKRSVPGCH